MQNYVFQLDANKRPLDMIHPAQARKLQTKGKAATFRNYPYTVIHSHAIDNSNKSEYILKIDPGAVWTGFAIQCDQDIIWGRTKFNRISQGLEKSHSIDAACVGESGANINLRVSPPLIVESKGHGTRQAIRCNRYGFPALSKNGQPIKPKSRYTHCQSGDMVKFFLDKDRKNATAGTYTARVKTPTPKGFEVKISGFRVAVERSFLIRFVHRNDGYAYSF
jgi:hypothetical protein